MSKPTLPGPHEGRFKDQIAIVTAIYRMNQ